MRSFVRAVPVLVFVVGCASSSTPEVHARASYDPDALTSAAFAEYDRDKNGALEGAELDACPALKSALAGIDTNRDWKISTAELRSRFEGYAASNAATVSVGVSVTLDGKPLADATVQFVPEPFMGATVQEATGKTGADGAVTSFTSGGQQYAGLQPGLYRVRITQEGGAAIPARFNTQTTLGAEVFGGRGARPLAFALVSR
jgi:hypothetical protein